MSIWSQQLQECLFKEQEDTNIDQHESDTTFRMIDLFPPNMLIKKNQLK